ncbi:MIP domain-containing protein [Cephalotus follicularis]|uniref:MIP domain-containing protein n=1 Tax=Cephalotus follicularis TaxID=3775 RepID=A0A1Q3BT68_CEPFO|nr:MIP domain-containing protein [Cephalotus follicularis]
MGNFKLIVSDFVMSFMWVWSGVLIKMFVYNILGLGHQPSGEVIKGALYIINMFYFAFLGKVTKGGAYNPLTILSAAISGDFSNFIFTAGARIPAQVIGSITGVRLIIETFPEIGLGPRLNVDLHQGALTEGLLTFAIVIISLGSAEKIPGSFFRKTWISSVSKLALHILGSDLTGGCMNPASVVGWAYARGDHVTKEHILVYWLAPMKATVLAVLAFKLLVRRQKGEKGNLKDKSE